MAWSLVAVALLAVAAVVCLTIRTRPRPGDWERAASAFRSLDADAFRNLIDYREEDFLRSRLPPRTFRNIKRQRALVTLAYVKEVGRAAATLARVGQAAQGSSDPVVAASGARVAESAFLLRLQTIRVSLLLLTQVAMPGLPSRAIPTLADEFERSADSLFRLKRGPTSVGRASMRSAS